MIRFPVYLPLRLSLTDAAHLDEMCKASKSSRSRIVRLLIKEAAHRPRKRKRK